MGQIPPKLRKQVFERDESKCQKCGLLSNHGDGLEIHHIIPFRICKEHKLDNLISLCHFCHAMSPYRKKDFYKFLKSKKIIMDKEENYALNKLFISDRYEFHRQIILFLKRRCEGTIGKGK